MSYRRAWIYDASEAIFTRMAERNSDGNTVLIPVQSPPRAAQTTPLLVLRDSLVGLLSQGSKFQSLVFATHGDSGKIVLDGEEVSAFDMKNILGKHGLERLLIPGGRVYFAGCNVAEGDPGWGFLEAAAKVFLNGSWGTVFAWTSYGIGFTRTLGLLPDNITHFWGRVRYVMISPGSTVLQRKDSVDIEHELGAEMRRMDLEREQERENPD